MTTLRRGIYELIKRLADHDKQEFTLKCLGDNLKNYAVFSLFFMTSVWGSGKIYNAMLWADSLSKTWLYISYIPLKILGMFALGSILGSALLLVANIYQSALILTRSADILDTFKLSKNLDDLLGITIVGIGAGIVFSFFAYIGTNFLSLPTFIQTTFQMRP